MFGGSLGEISTAGDWSDAILITDDETGEPLNLTGATITMTARAGAGDYRGMGSGFYDTGRAADLVGSTNGGQLTIPALGTVEWNFPAPLSLQPGEHVVGIIASRDGSTLQLFLGTVSVACGV